MKAREYRAEHFLWSVDDGDHWELDGTNTYISNGGQDDS